MWLYIFSISDDSCKHGINKVDICLLNQFFALRSGRSLLFVPGTVTSRCDTTAACGIRRADWESTYATLSRRKLRRWASLTLTCSRR